MRRFQEKIGDSLLAIEAISAPLILSPDDNVIWCGGDSCFKRFTELRATFCREARVDLCGCFRVEGTS